MYQACSAENHKTLHDRVHNTKARMQLESRIASKRRKFENDCPQEIILNFRFCHVSSSVPTTDRYTASASYNRQEKFQIGLKQY